MIPSIQLRIKNESDLYNPFDPAQTTINDGVYHYLKTFCTEAESKRHLHDTLQIISDGPSTPRGQKPPFRTRSKKIRMNMKGSLPKTGKERRGCTLSALSSALPASLLRFCWIRSSCS